MRTTNTQKTFKLSDWLTCYTDLISVGFTALEIETALNKSKLTKEDLTEVNSFENEPTYLNVYEIENNSTQITVKRYNGCWEREETVRGMKVRVKAQYQSLKHPVLFRQLLLNKFEWFESEFFVKPSIKINKQYISDLSLKDIPAEYQNLSISELRFKFIEHTEELVKPKWTIYGSTSNEHFEIYLETEFGTLYVPVKALINGKYEDIETRMNEYWGWYYKNDNNRLAEAKKPLKSKEAKKLKKLLTA